MALQRDNLVKVGLEGFAMIEEQRGHHTGKSRGVPSSQVHQDHYCETVYYHQYYYQQPYTYHHQGPQVSTVKEVVISRNEAARYYRGQYMSQGPQGPRVKEAAVTSNEAVQFYGGQYIQVPTKKQAIITSDEAAQIYGGIVIMDHPERKPNYN